MTPGGDGRPGEVARIRTNWALPGEDSRPLRIGLIVLATDLSSEREFNAMAPGDAVAVYATRIAYANPTTPASLRATADELTAAAALLLPEAELDVIAYGCTSAVLVLGEDDVAARLHAARPGVACTNPMSAIFAALERLGAGRVAVLAPYTADISRRFAESLAARGLDVRRVATFGLDDDTAIARLPREAILAAAFEADAPEAQALVIPCTALRVVGAIDELEAGLGKPVITSNQAQFWHALRLAARSQAVGGFGRLLRL